MLNFSHLLPNHSNSPGVVQAISGSGGMPDERGSWDGHHCNWLETIYLGSHSKSREKYVNHYVLHAPSGNTNCYHEWSFWILVLRVWSIIQWRSPGDPVAPEVLKVISFMSGLHSDFRRILNETRYARIDIHTMVREPREKYTVPSKMRWDIWDILVSFDSDWFTDMFPGASRWDKNGSGTWRTRQMYPSHSCSRLVLSMRM